MPTTAKIGGQRLGMEEPRSVSAVVLDVLPQPDIRLRALCSVGSQAQMSEQC